MWPKTGLAEAHEKAQAARALLRRGIDPRRAGITVAPRVKSERPASGGPPGHSVEHLAREFMARHVKRQRRRPEYVQRILDANVLPRWASRDARTIKPREVIELLDEIADRAPVIANRVAGILSQMFRFGIHRAILETTPVQLLYRPGGKEKPRARVFSEEELKAFITNLDDACRFQRLPHILRVLLLTLQRRGELALAEWREFNFTDKTWSIPDAHAKAGKGHVLPLADWTIEELQKLKIMADGSRYVLPSADGSAPADPKYITRSVARCLKRFRKDAVDAFTAHDLRRTGRTGLAKLGVKVDIAERVLNHARERIEATYDVHDYVDEKREALERWAKYLAELRYDQPPAPTRVRRAGVGRSGRESMSVHVPGTFVDSGRANPGHVFTLALWLLWQCIRLPLFLLFAILEPVITFVLGWRSGRKLLRDPRTTLADQ